MDNTTTNQIIDNIVELLLNLKALINNCEQSNDHTEDAEQITYLTIKECAQVFSGLSEHTVRLWAKSGKVKCFRAGEGERGKILVQKKSIENILQHNKLST